MTQDDCKLITEKLLGECWHTYIPFEYDYPFHCSKCGAVLSRPPNENRTFTNSRDFFACFEKLVELGEYGSFYNKYFWKYSEETGSLRNTEFTKWLLSRTESGHYRLCVLCAEWLKEGEQRWTSTVN
jgi:hypothetical protein